MEAPTFRQALGPLIKEKTTLLCKEAPMKRENKRTSFGPGHRHPYRHKRKDKGHTNECSSTLTKTPPQLADARQKLIGAHLNLMRMEAPKLNMKREVGVVLLQSAVFFFFLLLVLVLVSVVTVVVAVMSCR